MRGSTGPNLLYKNVQLRDKDSLRINQLLDTEKKEFKNRVEELSQELDKEECSEASYTKILEKIKQSLEKLHSLLKQQRGYGLSKKDIKIDDFKKIDDGIHEAPVTLFSASLGGILSPELASKDRDYTYWPHHFIIFPSDKDGELTNYAYRPNFYSMSSRDEMYDEVKEVALERLLKRIKDDLLLVEDE